VHQFAGRRVCQSVWIRRVIFSAVEGLAPESCSKGRLSMISAGFHCPAWAGPLWQDVGLPVRCKLGVEKSACANQASSSGTASQRFFFSEVGGRTGTVCALLMRLHRFGLGGPACVVPPWVPNCHARPRVGGAAGHAFAVWVRRSTSYHFLDGIHCSPALPAHGTGQ